MKRKTLKKLLTVVIVGLLFSTTIAYGDESYKYNFEVNIGSSRYTDVITKKSSRAAALVEQITYDIIMDYTIVNRLHIAKSNTVHLESVCTANIYYDGVIKGDDISLKIYNDPVDNDGRVRTVAGRWTP